MSIALDHIVWGVPDLDAGIAEFARRTGVIPARGGRHPDFGTHNALVSLGERTYLELLAPDPQPRAKPVGLGVLVEAIDRPTLLTFAGRIEAAHRFTAEVNGAGYAAEVIPGARTTPDGDTLEWNNVMLDGHGFGPSMPFFIAWGRDTPHPAASSPAGCSLESLEVRHPEARRLAAEFVALGVDVPVQSASRPGLSATLATPNGTVVLH